MIDRYGNPDDSREDDALLEREEQEEIERLYALARGPRYRSHQLFSPESPLRAMGATSRVELCFGVIINDDPRRYDPWPTTEDYNATPLKFARLA